MPRTCLAFASLVACLLSAACATTDDLDSEDRALSFDCGDSVVIGSLENNRDYQHVEIEDDILGHGWMTGALAVQRTVAGYKLEGRVPVRYFGHTYLRGDRTFMFVLTPKDDGVYHLRDQRLMSDRPRPTSECE